MKKTSLKKLSEQSEFSLSTLFRVLRNDPCVNAQTREDAIRLLNLHGYIVETHSGAEIVVVDCSYPGAYTQELAGKIIERLSMENYHILQTNSYKPEEFSRFKSALEEAQIVIFTGHTRGDYLKLARDINPEIYRVNIFGDNADGAELFIAADNTGGTFRAADYLCGEKKFRRVATFRTFQNLDFNDRADIFAGRVAGLYPNAKCDVIHFSNPARDLEYFYNKQGREYDAFFYPNGTPWVELAPLIKRDGSKIFQLVFENPEHIIRIRNISGDEMPLDAYIDWQPYGMSELISFYLRNRPLLQKRPRLIMSIPTFLQGIRPETYKSSQNNTGERK